MHFNKIVYAICKARLFWIVSVYLIALYSSFARIAAMTFFLRFFPVWIRSRPLRSNWTKLLTPKEKIQTARIFGVREVKRKRIIPPNPKVQSATLKGRYCPGHKMTTGNECEETPLSLKRRSAKLPDHSRTNFHFLEKNMIFLIQVWFDWSLFYFTCKGWDSLSKNNYVFSSFYRLVLPNMY